MAQQILLPKLGLTMEEGTILEWVVGSGDEVRAGDVIMRMATDKVDVDVEAEGDGRFQPVAEAGATLPPGALVGWLLATGEQPPSHGSGGPGPPVEAPAASDVGELQLLAPAAGVLAGARQRVSPNARRVAKLQSLDVTTVRGTGPGGRVVSEDVEDALAARLLEVPAQAAPTDQPTRDQPAPGRPGPGSAPASHVASPLVRRHAEARGIELASLLGTGVGGRVRRADVDQAAAATGEADRPTPAETPPGPRAGDVIELSGMRGAIARNMHASLQEMAQLTHGYEADVTVLMALREQLKAEFAGSGLRAPTINDVVVRATALALVRHPLLNATVTGGAVHLLEQVHVGVAVAVPNGLVVPVVQNADRRGLADIGQETARLAAAAREGRLTLPEMEGATFVVSSLGSYGIDFFTPVVNPGNVGILGVGRVRDGVRWEGDTPHRTQVLTLSLSFDHRAVDGAPAAEFLRTVADLLGRPLLLLAG